MAVVLSSFHPGGTEYQTTELIRRLPPDRWNVHAVCFHREGAWLPRIEGHVTSVTEFPIRSFKRSHTLAEMRRFASWCRAQRIDVVHAADLYANVFALPASAAAGVPLRIGSRRELNPDKTIALLALQRAGYACAHRILANSRAAAERLVLERVPRRRIAIIPNGLDLSRFPARPPEPESGMGGPTLITVANLRPEKGHAVLLEAFARMRAGHRGLRLRVVGDGPLRARLHAHAARLGVVDDVDFLGHREDVPALLAASGIAVLPSLSEAFPNAAIEAMAAGLPVIASQTGGLPEIVRHRRTGLLVKPGDVQGLVSALDVLVTDAALRRRLGAAGRSEVETHYSFDRMVAGVEALYQTELARCAARSPARVAVS